MLLLGFIVACFVVLLLFFYAFVKYFSTWPKGCLRAVDRVSGCVSLLVLGDLYPARGARLLQAAKVTRCFLVIAVSSLLRAAIPSGPELF